MFDRDWASIRSLELIKEKMQHIFHGERGFEGTFDFRPSLQPYIQQQIKKNWPKNETSGCILWKEEVVA
tara:strand:+ start:1159 stop:1365 length:207 start_codon:yes stop_codon:yes gene_type:complete